MEKLTELNTFKLEKRLLFQLWIFYWRITKNYDDKPCKGSEAEFKEFNPRLKFMPRLKYGWFQSLPLKIVFNFSRFKPALNWNRFLTDLSRGSNSLNSDTVSLTWLELPKCLAMNSWYPITFLNVVLNWTDMMQKRTKLIEQFNRAIMSIISPS